MNLAGHSRLRFLTAKGSRHLTSKQELAEKHNCLQLECENFESQLRLAERDASSSAKHRDEIAQEHWQHEKGASELLEKSQQQERAAEEFQRRFEEVETALEAAILAKERMEVRAAAAEGDLKVGQVWVAVRSGCFQKSEFASCNCPATVATSFARHAYEAVPQDGQRNQSAGTPPPEAWLEEAAGECLREL